MEDYLLRQNKQVWWPELTHKVKSNLVSIKQMCHVIISATSVLRKSYTNFKPTLCFSLGTRRKCTTEVNFLKVLSVFKNI